MRLPPDSLALALLRAADVLASVLHGRNLDTALATAEIPAGMRPAVMDLAYSTLRAYGRGDFLLRLLVPRPLSELRVRVLLLLALDRLERMPETAHTTVDQAVHVAALLSAGRYKGLVNGVLRNFLRRRDELLSRADAEAESRMRHPGWWVDKIRAAHPDAWEPVLAAGNSHPPMTLRVNLRRGSVAAYAERLTEAGIASHFLGGAALRLDRPVPVNRLPGFAAGDASVQDWGAQQAADLLAPRPGMRVLDACAAPGGKTAHLLEQADLDLVALDADAGRASRIGENLSRLGLAATVLAADCRRPEFWWDGRPFDRILADVPCSASGVVRRHPDAKWLRRVEDIAGFASRQREILDALWRVLAPGGTMLYCTCSVFAEENSEQVAAFVARHADARRLPTAGPELEKHYLPDTDHDGFYYALLEKSA
ncbi:MAG: 16S rRNA (cytosine(967)-C(5))-methyltransferase RsmB [Proteobacteria bacterium]|nr:16S rRNA (cytosine(967)-C(5))-methyltransferase RsmB [Pseudomonadota bacterium]HQR04069.1 16S rRNA (cytosine(967)-C(5))-methyltransferase RsmB [Rhodocyclaceae bacterium]